MRLAVVFYNDHDVDPFTRALLEVSPLLALYMTNKDLHDEVSSEVIPLPDGRSDPVILRPRSLQSPGLEIWLVYAQSKNWGLPWALDMLCAKADIVTFVYQSIALPASHKVGDRNIRSCTCWRDFISCVPDQHRTSRLSGLLVRVWNALVDPRLHKRAL